MPHTCSVWLRSSDVCHDQSARHLRLSCNDSGCRPPPPRCRPATPAARGRRASHHQLAAPPANVLQRCDARGSHVECVDCRGFTRILSQQWCRRLGSQKQSLLVNTACVIANSTTICVSQRNMSRTKAEMAEPHSTGANHHASTGTPAARSCASTRDAKEAVWMSLGPSKCMDTTVRPHCSSVRLRSSVAVVKLVFLPLASTKKWLGPSTSTATLPSGHSSSTSTTREPSPTASAACILRCRGQMPVGNRSQVSHVRILTRKKTG